VRIGFPFRGAQQNFFGEPLVRLVVANLSMIRPEKHLNALHALHLLFVQLRFMALTSAPLSDIATIADAAELLPCFIAETEDRTDEFARYLETIADRFPFCSYILRRFENSTP